MVRRVQLRAPRRSRRRLASQRDTERLRELARQTKVEMPRVIWAGEAKDAIRRLERNLTHHRQPSLFDGVGGEGR